MSSHLLRKMCIELYQNQYCGFLQTRIIFTENGICDFTIFVALKDLLLTVQTFSPYSIYTLR